MKALAIVPARSGSKGLPGKNLCTANWHTLVWHAVQAGLNASLVGDVIVTSDGESILKEGRAAGASMLIRRPAELSTDTAGTDDVLLHALREYGKTHEKLPEYTVLLQPTSPIRRHDIVNRCILRAENVGADSVFTAHEAHFVWLRTVNGPMLSNCLIGDRKPRQLMKESERRWLENGAVYVTRTSKLLATGQRLTGKVEMVVMNREDSIDIDTEYDLALADYRLRWIKEKSHLEGQKIG